MVLTASLGLQVWKRLGTPCCVYGHAAGSSFAGLLVANGSSLQHVCDADARKMPADHRAASRQLQVFLNLQHQAMGPCHLWAMSADTPQPM